MAVIEIAKIQVRRGQELQTGIPQLEAGEFGWAEDTEHLYIGKRIVEGANSNENTRILTQPDLDNFFNLVNDGAIAGIYKYRATTDYINAEQTTVSKKLDNWVSITDYGVSPYVSPNTGIQLETSRTSAFLLSALGTSTVSVSSTSTSTVSVASTSNILVGSIVLDITTSSNITTGSYIVSIGEGTINLSTVATIGAGNILQFNPGANMFTVTNVSSITKGMRIVGSPSTVGLDGYVITTSSSSIVVSSIDVMITSTNTWSAQEIVFYNNELIDYVDITTELNTSIQNLFNNYKNIQDSRKTLIIPAGSYIVSDTIKLPPYTTLVGDGPGLTKIIFNNSTTNLFKTVDGFGNDFESVSMMTSGVKRSKEVSIKGMTLEYGINYISDNALISLDDVNASKFPIPCFL
jgi:hypothetical protein